MADRQGKAMRIVVGIMLMAAFVLITFGILSRFAGAWGVPYFSYTTERGSSCTNNLTGYVCEPLTLADVEFYASAEGLDLPADSRVLSGTYRATHDYQLAASLQIPAKSAAPGLAALTDAFGGCRPGQPSPLNTRGLTAVCTMTNGDAVSQMGEPPSRLWVVGTALRPDGSRLVTISVRSR